MPMREPTPQDYDSEDGWGQDGLEQCPHCERQLSGESGWHGRVFDQQGHEFDHLLNTEPGNGPFFCEDCWQELRVNVLQQENATLREYGGDSE